MLIEAISCANWLNGLMPPSAVFNKREASNSCAWVLNAENKKTSLNKAVFKVPEIVLSFIPSDTDCFKISKVSSMALLYSGTFCKSDIL